MMHSNACLSCGGHSMKAGELREAVVVLQTEAEGSQGHRLPKVRAAEEEGRTLSPR